MITHLLDTSVMLKLLFVEGETEIEASHEVLHAHASGRITIAILDLGLYELGTALMRRPGIDSDALAAAYVLFQTAFGEPLHVNAEVFKEAGRLAHDHRLTFYDASWVAMAHHAQAILVSADNELLRSGLAISATQCADAL